MFALEKKIIIWYTEEKKNRRGKGGKYLDKEYIFCGKDGGEAKAGKYLEKYCGKNKEGGMKRRKIIISFS